MSDLPESPALLAADVILEDAPSESMASRRTLGIGFWIAVGWIVLIVLAALLAPYLGLKDPDENYINRDLGRPPYPPSGEFWFGSDQDARDVFSRTIYGARVSLVVGFAAMGCGMLFGGTLGMLAGFLRGWFDRVISFVFLVLLSFPALVLAILITSLLDRNLRTVAGTLGFLSIAPVGRLARATTIQYSEREFVLAARTLGAKNGRLMIRELLPNVVIPMGALALLGVAVAIVAEGALAFLGLSVEQELSWGKLILLGSGTNILQDAPWVSMGPIFVLFLTVLALNFAGDRVREYFDVRENML
ncbi:MAG: ABC transporter permease [Ilumatobacter sp.]|nr:ABC transporter permease [Ilumatobacter sp.]